MAEQHGDEKSQKHEHHAEHEEPKKEHEHRTEHDEHKKEHEHRAEPHEGSGKDHDKRHDGKEHHPEEHREFHIQIDRAHYKVDKHEMTGEQLRHVPPTPIGPDRDLFEVVPGGTDRKIGNTDIVEICDGKRFFTAPAQINPGGV